MISNILGSFVSFYCGTFGGWGCRRSNIALLWIMVTWNWNSSSASGDKSPSLDLWKVQRFGCWY